MTIHKRTKLTPIQRKHLWDEYRRGRIKVSELSKKYQVSRPTIYKILKRARRKEFIPRKSINKRFQCFKYGFRRLAKIERFIQEKLKKKAKKI